MALAAGSQTASLFFYTDSSGTSSPGSTGLSQPALLRSEAWGWQPEPRAEFNSDLAEPPLFGGEKDQPTQLWR